jgi:hypothetical protein
VRKRELIGGLDMDRGNNNGSSDDDGMGGSSSSTVPASSLPNGNHQRHHQHQEEGVRASSWDRFCSLISQAFGVSIYHWITGERVAETS